MGLQYMCPSAAPAGGVNREGFLSAAPSTQAENARAPACRRGFARPRSNFLNLRNLRNLRTNNLGREQHETRP
jgi:hypothetical protein